MYYIQKNGVPVATSDPNEVTKENFLVEPGAENKVWCKLEKYEFDRETGAKKALVNQVRADNPGDFDRFVREWKHQNMTITMLHDPREGKPTGSVPTKLAKLKAKLADKNENKNENSEGTPTAEDWQKTVEAKEMAEKKAAEAEEKLRLLEEKEAQRAKAEEEARLKAEEEARLKAEEEARLKAEEEARLKAEEEARLKAEEEARLKAEEEARLKAEDGSPAESAAIAENKPAKRSSK